MPRGQRQGPTDRGIDRVAETVRVIKQRHPNVEICTSLGLLTPERAARLVAAGVDAYNHNLNTSEEANYGEICSTHTFADRVDTVGLAQQAGLSPCSGAIFGMSETNEQIVDLAFDLRKLDPDSVPINFLIPFAGTPLADEWQLTPQRRLRILALFRFVSPMSRCESREDVRFTSEACRVSGSALPTPFFSVTT